jgi:hypothetical protein
MNKHTGPLKGAADLLKSQYVDRWGIICTAKQQSIGQHMYNVWILVTEWGHAVLSAEELPSAKELALTHDLAEIRTGDCPTPFKTPEMKAALDELEQDIYATVPVTGRVKELVKFCDTAESVLFLKLYGLGSHAVDVRELLATQMWSRLEQSSFTKPEQTKLHDLFIATFNDT